MTRLKRGVLMKNSSNWWEDVDEDVNVLEEKPRLATVEITRDSATTRLRRVTYASECLNVLMIFESRSCLSE